MAKLFDKFDYHDALNCLTLEKAYETPRMGNFILYSSLTSCLMWIPGIGSDLL